jgi:hypothetical protein
MLSIIPHYLIDALCLATVLCSSDVVGMISLQYLEHQMQLDSMRKGRSKSASMTGWGRANRTSSAMNSSAARPSGRFGLFDKISCYRF